MIKLVKMECPSCGATLEKKLFRHYKCNYCNSKYILDVDVIVPVPQKSKKGVDRYENKKNVGRYENKKNVGRINQNKSNANSDKKVIILTIVSICVVLCIAAITAIAVYLSNRDDSDNKANSSNSISINDVDMGIRSDYFKEFVKQAFGKDVDQVTEKELSEITYFVMKSKNEVTYKRNDGELMTAIIPNGSSIRYDDFKYFPEIKVLGWDLYKDENSALKYFPKLEVLTCSISPYLVLKYLPNPAGLKQLSCKWYEDGTGVGELEKFENLKDLSLIIHISGASKATAPDLSSVAKLNKLESFYLDNEDYLMVPFLSELRNLKRVSLHCDSLKDLSFLNNLSKLEELTLVDCDILSVDNLKYTPNLKVLHLEDCYQVDSYEPVIGLGQLEELMLSYHYGQTVPESFKTLSKVRRLIMAGFNDISFLSDFPDVTFLQLSGCNYSNFNKVSCMKNLQELKMSGGYNLNSVSVLTELTNLQKVDFSRMSNNADTEKLFMIPNLKDLNVNDTEFTIDLNLVEKNESLEVLNMENLKWKAFNTVEGERKYNYENWKSLPMSECIDFLANFPNLKVLSLQGNKLDSVEFTKDLKKLQVIDITNNYVTDIQVLNQLQDLTTVLCGENPITTKTGIDSRINVDDTTKATERWPFIHYDW